MHRWDLQRLDRSASCRCRDQDGTQADDVFYDVAAVVDGSMILAGTTNGTWVSTHAGGPDFAVMKLDSNGTIAWKWQVLCSG